MKNARHPDHQPKTHASDPQTLLDLRQAQVVEEKDVGLVQHQLLLGLRARNGPWECHPQVVRGGGRTKLGRSLSSPSFRNTVLLAAFPGH